MVDTGGMEPSAKVGLEALVTLQAKIAVEEADVILHLVDSRTGLTEADSAIARQLRKSQAPVVLAVNKLDNPSDDAERYQFYSLGEGEPYAISGVHGIGVGDLLDVVIGLLPDQEIEEEDALPPARDNRSSKCRKSTLLNQLLGSERAVVSEVAGTTTDAVAGEVEIEGERYVLLDTAGVNRSAKRADGVPYYSYLRTEEAIRGSDVSLLLIDSVDGMVGGDLQLARKIEESGKACGIVINKRDLVSPDRIRELSDYLGARMTDLKPPSIAISALSGSGLDQVLGFAAKLRLAHNLRLTTHEVAEFINHVVGRSAPAKGVKIRYATQTGSAPPKFTIFANRPQDVQDSYLRYIENSLRDRYGLYGVSLKISVKSSR